MTGCSFAAAAFAAALVGCTPTVQKPFETSPRHEPKLVMGREYWTYLSASPYTDPHFLKNEEVWKNPWNNRDLVRLPLFRDCALVVSSGRPPPDAKGESASWGTVYDNFGKNNDQWACLEENAKSDKPLVVVFSSKRNVLAMAGDVTLDGKDWADFKAAHPNLVCTRTMCEWGNDLLLNIARTTNVLNRARREELERTWAKHDMSDRDDRLALCRWYTDRKLKLHYDDLDTFMAFRGAYHLDHVAAAWGAKALVAETTNTTGPNSEYRWDVAGMFIRGAARQFQLPWAWYVAVYYNGPCKDGTWMNNSVCNLRTYGKGRKPTPERGVSAAAQRRVCHYAYLNGANAVEPESWSSNFFTTNTPSGKAELSERGRNFAAFHDFTKAHPDRGVTYAPVAILTPFNQGYTAYGGRAWCRCPYTDGDYAIDSVFFTIAPGWKRAEGIRAGDCEGNLHNSRFAMMYDVLVPDSPQPKDEFAKALFAYPAAILVGDYPHPEAFADVLAAYEKAGGRLVRITADMLPPRTEKNDDLLIKSIYRGERTFPEVEKRLAALQRDLFPFEVEGDCQYGANRTKDGWWLWVFNNKGVVKFADTAERIDHAKDAKISVSLGKVRAKAVVELMTGEAVSTPGGRFTAVIPAGDFRVFEVK